MPAYKTNLDLGKNKTKKCDETPVCLSLVRVKGTKEPCWRTQTLGELSQQLSTEKKMNLFRPECDDFPGFFLRRPPTPHSSIKVCCGIRSLSQVRKLTPNTFKHTHAPGTKIRETLKRPCGGILEEPPRSHWHWKVTQSSSQGTCNKARFYSLLHDQQRRRRLLQHSLEEIL